jgi:hypothetical protein
MKEQRTHIPRVPQCLSPRSNWDPPPLLLPLASEPPPPLEPKGGGTHSPACEGVEESQFRRLEIKLCTLSTLWSLTRKK